MRREDGAEEVGAVSPDQLAGVIRQDVHHVPGVRSWPEGPRGGHGPVAVSNLTAGEGRGGRREPSGGGRLYGNMHHNSLGQCHPTGLCQKSRTLWEEKLFLFLVLQTPMVSGVRRVCAKDGGGSALSLSEESFPTLNKTLWWLCAKSSAQDVLAWGTLGLLWVFFSLTSAKKTDKQSLQRISQCWTCLISALLSVAHLMDSFSRCTQYRLSVNYLSFHFEILNQSTNPLNHLGYCRSVTICWQ